MAHAMADEETVSEASSSDKRSRFRSKFLNRLSGGNRKTAPKGTKLQKRSSRVSVSVSKSSQLSLDLATKSKAQPKPTWKVKGMTKGNKVGGAVVSVVSNLKQKTKTKKKARGKGKTVEIENTLTFNEENTNFEPEVRSPEDENAARPWRLEKASNVQKPKTLHKTGKEKKEDSFRQAPRAPAPPSDLHSFPKYEYCSLTRMHKVSAPKLEKPPVKAPPSADPLSYKGTITDLEIRVAMKTWIWRRTGFKHYDIIRHMKVESITDRHRYRYKLESFMERRSCRWIKIPYHGDELPVPEGEKTPVLGPWEIPVKPTNGTLWEEETILMPVPGTTLLYQCENCRGRGWIKCWKCDQAGNYLCYWCDGKGGFYDGEGHWKYCWTCKGIGIVYCAICNGYTKLVCVYCEGYFEVKFFIQLKIEYFIKVHKYYIEEHKTDVPTQKEKKWTGCRSGSGETVLTEEQDRLSPLSKFNVAELNEISHGAIARHDNYYTGLRIHRQRHSVDVIPIYEVEASWKETNFMFWIYGQKGQRKIFFPDADAFLPVRKLCCVL